MTGRLTVLGVGIGGGEIPMPDEAREAQVLAGGRELLDRASWFEGERLPIAAPLAAWIAAVGERLKAGRNVLVLADGDPLFFGIGPRLKDRFPEAVFRPGPTCLQEAAARLGLPWAGVPTVSLHGRSDWSPLWAAMTHHPWVGLYTDKMSAPAQVAARALERGVTGWRMHVFARLNASNEGRACVELAQATGLELPGPWFILLERTMEPPCRLVPGLRDKDIVSRGRPMTKAPVRAVGLARLRLGPEDTVWDLGAGCGSVSLEASAILPRGRVMAVERDPGRAAIIAENRARFGAWMMEVVQAEASGVLKELSVPDAVFVGGGIRTPGLLEGVVQALRPGGRVVVHAVLLESMHTAMRILTGLGLEPELL
ncbi:MAG: precorrin-6Y C5,15-methyltransferase (decarboxylating) subunit CbiT, partial [Deltaproteobacteria bacterium]|nr:precorrin-6Y C5,15-methyltransferase (decarboxylating) subunit CbiT [Deltaproteobacteria bacterium]